MARADSTRRNMLKPQPPGEDGERTPGSAAHSGLGRGLSGILGDAGSQMHSREVSELLGSSSRRNSPAIRRLVAELAVDAVSSGFQADGVVMARLDADGEVDPLQTRLASTWTPSDPLGFEVNGRLWEALHRPGDETAQVAIGRWSAVFCRQILGSAVVAAAVVRSEPFDDHEQEQLSLLMRSAARATEVGSAIPESTTLRVLVSPSEDRFLADVRLVDGQSRRHGASVGSTEDAAVAQAAVELCDLPMDVRFAGSTIVEDDHVSIVVLQGEAGTVFGLAVTTRLSSAGLVEATFAAAASAGAEPFSSHASA